ncbi:hypothetical protein ABFS82_06G137200 [Erythranthe guttata]|uniref:Arginyl-tRNA--protein transferase n=1 Tax=Erythranthe guttata TaxID=4155 RepID=A0A022Q735_ERYGU|nr:PREDICTED: arginyl-tRNA--protein transferase 2-like [Erythranthe guttata]EYU22340.1 hypothetical protein MIMGU_mgv1a003118mg [Erythranthe guttata]|eukprot:XP_012855495.1 PREDICTED: arginyl-tRNA--protein transferase 2-like [Erythranthe guttata]
MAEAKKKRGEEASTSGGGGGGIGGRGESVVTDCGRQKSTCGYCKSGARTSISHGLWPQSLTVDDYQALIDRGWRRSGCYLYKPDMEKTCCPSYTIRLKTSEFVPSKEQVRVSKRMQRFLDGTLDVKKTNNGESCNIATESPVVDGGGKDETDQFMHFFSEQINNSVQVCVKSGEFPSDIQLPKASIKRVVPAKRNLQADNSEELIFSCNIAFQISATLRRFKKDFHTESSELSPTTIAEILASHSKQTAEACGLSVRACYGHINFYSFTKQSDLIDPRRSVISKPAPTTNISNERPLKRSCGARESQRHKFEIRLKQSSFDYEEYSLYKKYQLTVHNDVPDDVTESSYKRFLVDTPLTYIPPNDNNAAVPPCGFGSFHQQYLVDGKLIAVGVVDILPKCLSSKYLFWDPDFAFLSLGKFSALQEIKWVNESQLRCPSLQYYYLGYYIHSCSKMRYKAAYRPSELLCPFRYQWVPYDISKPFLDRKKYVILSDYATSQKGESLLLNVLDNHMEDQENEATNDVLVNEDEIAEFDSDFSDDESDESDSETNGADVSNVLIGVRANVHRRFKDLRHAFDQSQRKFVESQIQRYVRAVGTELSEKMVYSLA